MVSGSIREVICEVVQRMPVVVGLSLTCSQLTLVEEVPSRRLVEYKFGKRSG